LGELIERIPLDNGLNLELYNRSRPVAGDRWLVSLEARIEIEVKPEYFMGEEMPPVTIEEVKAILGEKITYRYDKQRNFIVETEKEAILNGLKARFLDTTFGYLSSPGFPRRFIERKYQEATSKLLKWRKI
jgi:hypothetical protein